MATEREKQRDPSTATQMKKESVSFLTSLQEMWAHVKAIITCQVKKATAKNEQEATAAEMETAKQQVEATEAAETKKNQLGMY